MLIHTSGGPQTLTPEAMVGSHHNIKQTQSSSGSPTVEPSKHTYFSLKIYMLPLTIEIYIFLKKLQLNTNFQTTTNTSVQMSSVINCCHTHHPSTKRLSCLRWPHLKEQRDARTQQGGNRLTIQKLATPLSREVCIILSKSKQWTELCLAVPEHTCESALIKDKQARHVSPWRIYS